MPQPLKSVDGKTAGFIKGKTFFKKCKASIHQLRTPAGWAIDAVIYDSLYDMGVEEILIFETEHNITFRSSLNNYHIHRVMLERHNYGKQWALAMRFWLQEPTNPSEVNSLMAKEPKKQG